ncbi:MAG TPA: hypothetical protein VF459_19840 [Caulobacteraceae bacterium]
MTGAGGPANTDLATRSDIDFAAVELDYEAFRQLARNPHLDPHQRIGFPTAYREGAEAAIFEDILAKLPMLAEAEGQRVVDIGPGCAGLPRLLIELCRQRRHTLVLADSEEMLSQLPDAPGLIIKCPGRYPDNAQAVQSAVQAGADAALCYSVFHYVFSEGNPFAFLDALVALLRPQGRALIGDIPNHSKRRRFFASDAGQAFHRAFTGSTQPPVAPFNVPAPGKIDDAVLGGLIQRAQAAGCDAYLLPQGAGLPMANRRDDLLIARP